MRTAIVGLGLIGAAWARHLEEDGVLGATWNRTKKEDFPRFISDLVTIPTLAEIVHVVVSDERAAFSVIERLAGAIGSSHTIIQSTTIDPATSTKLKQLVESKGASYLECPFTGSLPAAQQRKTVFLMGGDAALIERVTPYLQRLSQHRFHIGSSEQACVIKLALNLQIASAMAAIAEALTICRESGIDDETYFSVFKQTASYSGVAALKEQKLRDGDYAPQFSIKHMAKDMRLLQESAPEQFEILAAVRKLLMQAEGRGWGDEDFSAIIKLLCN